MNFEMIIKNFLCCIIFMGVINATKIGYFWHITDLHYDPLFSTQGDVKKACWRSEGRGNRRPIGRFGDFNCDSPWVLIESAIQAMRQIQNNIEFILWTGDALAPSVKRWPESYQLELLQNVTDLLKRTFSSDFVFPALGHNDPQKKRSIGEFWRLWLPPDSMYTFEKDGYYMIERRQQTLQIIVLNTNLLIGREDSKGYLDERSKKMWDWLDLNLKKCKENKQTVYLVGHHPPGVDGKQKSSSTSFNSDAYTVQNNQKYIKLVQKYSEIIAGQFFGHLHSDTFRLIYNEKGRPISWALISPSVTPRNINNNPNNPGLRLYKFDTDTGTVFDYTQYFLDLNKANALQEAEWVPFYNFTSYYGLSNISATSLDILAEKFTQPIMGENTYFSRYFVANAVRIYPGPTLGGCDYSCSHTHYCAITRVDYSDYKLCVEAAAGALASSTNANLSNADISLRFKIFFTLVSLVLRQILSD